MQHALRPLEQVTDDLWAVVRPQSFFGLQVGARMTVIRLSGDRLLLHSPVALDTDLRRALDAIGRVCFAVAPNRLHHLYAGQVAEFYPQSKLWLAPGLESKRPDLVHAGVLSDEAPAEWRGEIDQIFSLGRPFENEVAFLHRASRTLILCDLAFNFGESAAPSTRLIMKMMRSYGRLAPTKMDPLLVRDRKAARESLERILEWDFDRIVVSHGEVLERGGRQILREGYRWLLESK